MDYSQLVRDLVEFARVTPLDNDDAMMLDQIIGLVHDEAATARASSS